ncbi:MAG: tandem-95 repeat protein, partial [Candidatus Marinimicrobia bacterium]|nr:tandem-95 repeat protein [Candidatus Neomarinimicrobiota bacterium]
YDSLRFKVDDGELSDTATIVIEVLAVNDPPQAFCQAIETKEDTSVAFVLTGYDEDKDELIYSVLDSTLNGMLSGSLPELTYTPDPDYFGQDSMRFIVSDGHSADTGKVNIEVLAVNDPPEAVFASYEVLEDSSLILVLEANDIDNDAEDLNFTVLDSTINGILSGTAPNLLYKPYKDYAGPDSLHFIVDDGEYADTSTIVFTIFPVNDPPVWTALPDTSFNEDDSLKVHLSLILSYLQDRDDVLEDLELTFEVPDVFHYGMIDSILYLTADANWFGEDSIRIQASDGTDSTSVTWRITVLPVNDPPVFTSFINNTLYFDADRRDTTLFSELFTDIDTPDSLMTVAVASTNILYEVVQIEALLVLYVGENTSLSETVTITLNDGDNEVVGHLDVEITEVAIEFIPEEFALHAPYPNPFNPVATIPYDIPEIADVSIIIYDIEGKKVKTLVKGTMEAHAYRLIWNGSDDHGSSVASGIYICRMTARSDDTTYLKNRKLLFVK